MEISRLRAELARVKMERDILGKATAYFARFCRDSDVQLNEAALLPQIKTPASRTDLLATRFAL
jgi:transposase-like protein